MDPIIGQVVSGKQQARTLGYPTANLTYTSPDRLAHGIWSCSVEHAGRRYQGLAVIGMWQLENSLPSLEVHVLDFSGDLYGEELVVHLKNKLRNLQSFDDVTKLTTQIAYDVLRARDENGL